jgi:hypothetical protein
VNNTIDIGSTASKFKNLHINSVTGLTTPVNPSDAASKSYVDGLVTPTMTSNSQNGYMTTASSNYDASFAAFKAYDNRPFEGQGVDPVTGVPVGFAWAWSWASEINSFSGSIPRDSHTKFGVTALQEWHQMELPASVSMKTFKHKARGDSSYNGAPRDFKVYTSTDGSTWALLLTVVNHSQTSHVQENEWLINGFGKYIGISITKNNGASAVVLGEIIVKGYSPVKSYADSLVGRLNVYTRATMPPMPDTSLLGAMIYVTDADPGAFPGCPLYCDGANWKKVTEKSSIFPPP